MQSIHLHIWIVLLLNLQIPLKSRSIKWCSPVSCTAVHINKAAHNLCSIYNSMLWSSVIDSNCVRCAIEFIRQFDSVGNSVLSFFFGCNFFALITLVMAPQRSAISTGRMEWHIARESSDSDVWIMNKLHSTRVYDVNSSIYIQQYTWRWYPTSPQPQ